MKIGILTNRYPSYWRRFYQQNPHIAKFSYDEQILALQYDSFGTSGAWVAPLAARGCAAAEILSNVPPLQRAWVRENGQRSLPRNWIEEVPHRQIRALQPDVLLIEDPRQFDRQWISKARKDCPSIRLVIGMSCSPSYDLQTIQTYDAILSCNRALSIKFAREGCRSYYFSHSFDAAVLDRIHLDRVRANGVIFSGSINRNADYHLDRDRLLEEVSGMMDLSIHTPQSNVGFCSDLIETMSRRLVYTLMTTLRLAGADMKKCRKLPGIGKAATWTSTPISQINSKLRPHLQPAVYGLAMYRTLHAAAVTLNVQGGSPASEIGRESTSMRLFEATGVGTCLLTDWKDNLPTLFEPDKEVVTYRSAEECAEKAKWLIEHPVPREEIARAGQARTLRDHTFSNRADELAGIIRELVA